MKLSIKPPFFMLFVVGALAAIVLLVALRFGESAGREHAVLVTQRLDSVFGDVKALPEIDRALLASMALTCKLYTRPLARHETLRCLREAADSPSLLMPKGVTDAPAQLQRLLQNLPKSFEATSQFRG